MSYFVNDLPDNNNDGSGTEDDECDREVADIFGQLDLQQEEVGKLRKDIRKFQPIITTTPTQLTTIENKMPDRRVAIREKKQKFVDELKEDKIPSVPSVFAFPDVDRDKSEEEKQKELVEKIEENFPKKSSPQSQTQSSPQSPSQSSYESDDESTDSAYLSDDDYIHEILDNADDWIVIISRQPKEAIDMKMRLTKYVIDTYLEVYQNNLGTTHRETIYQKIRDLFNNISINNEDKDIKTQIDGALLQLEKVNKSVKCSQQDLQGLIGKRKRPEEREESSNKKGGRRFTRKVIKKRGGKKLVKSRKNVVRKTYKKMKNVKKVKKSKGKKRKTRKSKK